MANWNAKTCGNCGFVASGDAALEKVTCPKCGVEQCPVCYGGKPKGTPGEMCRSCGYRMPQVKERLKKIGMA